MAGSTAFDEYVAWYSWARRTLGGDSLACHAAATAATRVLSASGDREEAAAAARRAAGGAAIQDQIRADYGRPHRYVEWFLWARDHLRLPDELCHEAATLAVRALDSGGTSQSAAEAAASLILPLATWTRSQKTAGPLKQQKPAAALASQGADLVPSSSIGLAPWSSMSLVLRYGWRSLMYSLITSAAFILWGVVWLVWVLTNGSSKTWIVYVYSVPFIVLGLILLLNGLVPAARHWVAVGIDASGILLKPGPVLGRRPRWGRTPNCLIPWTDICAVRVGKLTVNYSGGMYGDYPMTAEVPMMTVTLKDGRQVLKDLKGIRYDCGRFAAAIAVFAPQVDFSEGVVSRG